MLKFSLLGSGSKGNATLIVSRTGKILVDSGYSFKRLQERVAAAGETLDGLQAVFVTHEHRDHVNGIGVLARRTGVPIYMTGETFANLPDTVGELPRVEHFEAGDTIRIADLEVSSFSVSHDAADPVSYTVAAEGARLGFATDLGHVSHLVRTRLTGCHALVLESNHCPQMLRAGPYPPQLQQRIHSRIGHLSNQDMTSLLSALLHDGLQTVVLFHISENNNTYDLAHRMAAGVLGDHPAQVFVAEQDRPTPLFEVRP